MRHIVDRVKDFFSLDAGSAVNNGYDSKNNTSDGSTMRVDLDKPVQSDTEIAIFPHHIVRGKPGGKIVILRTE